MSGKRQCVLFVDDEEYILKAIKRVCRREAFDVLTSTSSEEALGIMAVHKVDLIVSDLRMPDMDGAELLREVAKRYPGLPRILLSGNADLPAVIKAVNEGQLSYYFQKPWDDDALRLTLRNFLDRKKLEDMEFELSQHIHRQNEELKQLNQQLEAQSKTIIAESDLKSKLFSTMSHEIRTPLNGLLGVLELLKISSPDATDREELIQTSLSCAKDLKRIADDVLDFTKLQANKLEFEISTFHPFDVVQAVHKLMRPHAEKRELKFNVHSSISRGETLLGDPGRIRQVLLNLISNAIKFTEFGSVTIRAATNESGQLTVSVTDTGIGISKDRQPLLFTDFQMLDPEHSRRYGGTGLGLSISKQIVDQMRGVLTVKSEPGAGSTFTVNLPLKPAVLEETQQQQFDLSGCVFLAVDDNHANLLVVQSLLEKHNASVHTVDSGLAAIRFLREKTAEVDAVLMDINMPGIDGVETLRIIQDEKLSSVPIYALTAYSDDQSMKRIRAEGFASILAKPIEIDTMLSLLANSDESQHTKSTKHSTDFSISTFEALIQNTDRARAQNLIDVYEKECNKRQKLIESAIAATDFDEIASHAHALSSSAAMYGATALYNQCKDIQKTVRAGEQVNFANVEQLMTLLHQSVDSVKDAYRSMLER